MGELVSVNFDRCGYCGGLFYPGQVSITAMDRKRYHAGPPKQCHHKHCEEAGARNRSREVPPGGDAA